MTPIYPANPTEWILWIESKIDIDERHGRGLCESSSFPLDRLIAAWEEEFSIDKGYSPEFIPALVRNKRGFLKWVYLGSNEPNWRNSD